MDSIRIENRPQKMPRPTSLNKGHPGSACKRVACGSQMAWNGCAVVRTPFRAGAKANRGPRVRNLFASSQGVTHDMLRALITGAIAPHFIRVLAFRASQLQATSGPLGRPLGDMGLEMLPLRVKKEKVFFGARE
jgi:hypothetical protein